MKNIHFLLRYSDKLAKGADTIAEHRSVLEAHGCVWLGKFGVGIGYRFAELAKLQIERKHPCFLYLMNGSKLTAKSNIIDLAAANTSRGDLLTREGKLTPLYYRDKRCSVWFKLDTLEEINNKELNSLWLYNNPASHPSLVGMRGLTYLTDTNQPIELQKKDTQAKPSIYTESLFD